MIVIYESFDLPIVILWNAVILEDGGFPWVALRLADVYGPRDTTTRWSLYQSWWIFNQGILKGEVSLYHWPPVWLVWNQLYDKWQILFLFAKHTNPNQSNRRSMVLWYFPLKYSLLWLPFYCCCGYYYWCQCGYCWCFCCCILNLLSDAL